MAKNPDSIPTALLRALTENIGLKLFSLLIALVLYSFVRGPDGEGGAGKSQQTFDVDVVQDITANSSTHVLVSDVPPLVRVTLEGSRYILSTVDPEKLKTRIQLTDPTMKYYYFDPKDLHGAPVGLTVTFEPRELPLKWDNRIERTISVRVRVDGAVPEGFQVVEPIRVSPTEVRVAGAQGSFPRGEVATEPIDISGLTSGRHERTLRLEPPPAHVNYQNTSTVDVVLEVIPLLRERVLRNVEVVPVGPSGRVRPKVVDVTLSGPPTQVDALTGDSVIPWVDARQPTFEGTAPVPVQVRGVPEGVTVSTITPPEVLLSLE